MADASVNTGASGAPIRVLTNLGTGNADQQVVTLADSAGNLLGSSAAPFPTINPDVTASGTITVTDAVVAAPGGAGATVSGASTAGSLVHLACPGGDSAWNVQVTGLTSGTLYFEESLDSTTGTDGNWIAVNARQSGIVNTTTGYSTTTSGVFRGNTSGAKWFRVRSVGALTGTPAVVIRMSSGTGAIFLNASLPTGNNVIGYVQQMGLPKGTQGITGVTTQDLKDAGRTAVVLSAAGVVSVTAVALMTLNQYVGGVVTSSATYTVPAGKTFRIQSIQFGSRFTTPSTTVTFASTTFALRFVTTGTTVVGSPILHQDSKLSASNTPTPNSDMAIPDGLELPAGYNIGVTHLASAATLSEDVAIVGFLY